MSGRHRDPADRRGRFTTARGRHVDMDRQPGRDADLTLDELFEGPSRADSIDTDITDRGPATVLVGHPTFWATFVLIMGAISAIGFWP